MYRDSVADWTPALPVTAPEGAPNVVVIVLDDHETDHERGIRIALQPD